jgi:RNA polymerase sigma factor (sigma-70 family)
MQFKTWTDADIIAAYKRQDMEVINAFLKHLYCRSDWYRDTLSYVRANSGNEQDAEDVFQSSLADWDQNLMDGKFTVNPEKGSLKAYFMVIVRNKWLNILRSRKVKFAEIKPDSIDVAVSGFTNNGDIYEVLRSFAREILEQIPGKHCKTLMLLRYEKYSWKQIAEMVGISNEQSARIEEQRCRKRLESVIEHHPRWKIIWEEHKEDLLNMDRYGN